MKRTQLVLSVLALGLSGIAQGNPFPADGEGSYHLQAPGSYADTRAGASWDAHSAFLSDGEVMVTVQARGSYAEKHAADAVRERGEPSIAFVSIDD